MGEGGSVDCGENNFLKIFENFQKILKKTFFHRILFFLTLFCQKKNVVKEC